MNFKTISKEELETLQFDDIAYIILKEKGKKMKITDIFKIICDSLNLGEAAFENQIGDFFALLTTEKRFIQLEKGYWDLRENHTAEISIKEIEEELEDEIIDEEEMEMEEPEEDEGNYYDDIDDMNDDKEDDDYKDLVIVDEGFEDESEL
jgi:DNA-directed RNA polymerase delta subunit